MKLKRYAATLTVLAVLATGCGRGALPQPAELDADAPAAQGLPPRPAAGQPSPLLDREPFGLFRDAPTSATLTTLSTALVSPDGRYRAAMTAQGGWVVRVDGAWLWQLEAPPLPPPPTPPGKEPTATVPGQPAPTKPTAPPPVIRSLEWMLNGSLLLRDESGRWLAATPERAQVTILPALFQGKYGLQFSPNGTQVLYSTMGRAGEELWVAFADGSKPTLLGSGVTGWWDEQGKPAMRKTEAPAQAPGARKGRQPRFILSPW